MKRMGQTLKDNQVKSEKMGAIQSVVAVRLAGNGSRPSSKIPE